MARPSRRMTPWRRGRRPNSASTVSERPRPPVRPGPGFHRPRPGRTHRAPGAARRAVRFPARPVRRRAGRRGRLAVNGAHFAPGHELDDVRLRQSAGRESRRHRPALAQHRHAVGDRQHFLQPVRDERQRMAGVAQSGHDLEQAFDLAGAERGGGLVEHDQFGVQRQGLGDFDQLPLGRGKMPDLGLQRGQAGLAQEFRMACARRRSAARRRRPGRPSSGRKRFSSTLRSGASRVSCITIASPLSSASRADVSARGGR